MHSNGERVRAVVLLAGLDDQPRRIAGIKYLVLLPQRAVPRRICTAVSSC
jgi:hypothetical protein